MEPKNNSLVILIVVSTVCLLSTVGVGVLAACAFWKIPDMSGSMSAALTQTTSTLVGALITLLASTRSQEVRKEDGTHPPSVVAAEGGPVIVNQPEVVTTQPAVTPRVEV